MAISYVQPRSFKKPDLLHGSTRNRFTDEREQELLKAVLLLRRAVSLYSQLLGHFSKRDFGSLTKQQTSAKTPPPAS